MTTILIILILYIIGCILALGVIGGLQWDLDRRTGYKPYSTVSDIVKDREFQIHLIFSWLTVFAGLTVFLIDDKRHNLIKYNFKNHEC
jgi:uncharacterized membrane protein